MALSFQDKMNEVDIAINTLLSQDTNAADDAIAQSFLVRKVFTGDTLALKALECYIGENGRRAYHVYAEMLQHINATSKNIDGLREFFRSGMTPTVGDGFFAMLGYFRLLGVDAYPELLNALISHSSTMPLKESIVRLLSIHSGQPFNRGLPRYSPNWREDMLRYSEIVDWQNAGYPCIENGKRILTDYRVCLKASSALELAIQRIDQILEEVRCNDPEQFTNPVNFFKKGSPEDVDFINANWKLPDVYLKFLRSFSTEHIECQFELSRDRVLKLYSASEARAEQVLYSNDLNPQAPPWNKNHFVIGDISCDPVVIDLSKIKDGDAMCFRATHGQYQWKFRKFADSFLSVLNSVKVSPLGILPASIFDNGSGV